MKDQIKWISISVVISVTLTLVITSLVNNFSHQSSRDPASDYTGLNREEMYKHCDDLHNNPRANELRSHAPRNANTLKEDVDGCVVAILIGRVLSLENKVDVLMQN